MRRLIDIVLIGLLLAAVGLGAYAIGHRVDTESNNLSSKDPELHSTTLASGHTTTSNKHRTEIIVGVALGGTVVLILIGSLTSSLVRGRKREHWRA
jgi:nitric oxide reductase large subunit